MKKTKTTKEFYNDVATANEGVTVADVRNLFIWYDLLSYALPFQLIFIFIYAIGAQYYAFTILSVFGILIIDNVLKKMLEADATKFSILQKNIPLVKLWVIPLIGMGIVTTAALLYATFTAVL